MGENETMVNEVTVETEITEGTDKGSVALGAAVMAFAAYGLYSGGKWVYNKGKELWAKRSDKKKADKHIEKHQEKETEEFFDDEANEE